MHPTQAIYLIPDHASDTERYTTPEYHALATFLREEALTLTRYDDLKTRLSHLLGTSVEMWAMDGIAYIGISMIPGTGAFPFAVPEWRRVYRLVTQPEGADALPDAAVLIADWQALPSHTGESLPQTLTGDRSFPQ